MSIFTGKERDSESGNDYFGARYYTSDLGRFLIPDWSAKAEPVPYAKLDNPQTLNLYSYVRNNPITLDDPDGHAGEEAEMAQVAENNHSMDAAEGTYSAGAAKPSPPDSSAQQHGFFKRLGSYIYLKGEKGANGAESGDSVSGKMGPVKGKIEVNKDVNEQTRHLDGSNSTEHVKESGIGVEIPGLGLIGITRETTSKNGEAPETHWHSTGERGHASASSGQVGLGVEFCHGVCGGIEVGVEAGKMYHDYTNWVASHPQYF